MAIISKPEVAPGKKTGPFKQMVLFLLFVVPISGFLIWKYASSESADDQRLSTEEALRRYGFGLTESAKDCGIDFVHQAPTLDHQLDHIMPQIASMGASVSIVD